MSCCSGKTFAITLHVAAERSRVTFTGRFCLCDVSAATAVAKRANRQPCGCARGPAPALAMDTPAIHTSQVPPVLPRARHGPSLRNLFRCAGRSPGTSRLAENRLQNDSPPGLEGLLGVMPQKFSFMESWAMRGGAAKLTVPKRGVVDTWVVGLKLLSPLGAINWA